MPVRRGEDSKGPYYQWGERGRRYRYRSGDDDARRRARARAESQGRAVKARESGSDKPRRRGGRRSEKASSSDTFKPTAAAAKVAQATKARRDALPPSRKGLTPVGARRMSDFIGRRPMSLSVIRRIARFGARKLHNRRSAAYRDRDSKSNIQWGAWGGDPGIRWALGVLRKHDREWYDTFAKSRSGAALIRFLSRR